jgi:hypothetical protein
MTLKSVFSKPVDRTIEGVIKADDQAALRLEIEEYVLTNEVAQRLETFLGAYTDYRGANGVWISGFFGSGKSHLLKMLAVLLEDREIDGESALALFLPKCGDNEMLRADLQRAARIPSRSILFNIDQKADVISKKDIDALLAVFVKVFDESCGYYGKQPFIAQFERDLDGRDQLGPFRRAYERIAGHPWARGREQYLLEGGNIARAYAEVTGADPATADGILNRYRADYRLSIEDFAETINAFVERQPPEFRLNFFVDEVGQYIADNVKLMTNLQTVAESLATRCKGRAWVVVTSQNDMQAVLGEVNRQQTNDFSKIQARFATRILLTSTNVAVVIQERLLAKTEAGASAAGALYGREKNNFGTLFDFADGSRRYRNYRDEEEFVRCYPFVPYQFELFQAAIEGLSSHNAFEGKHSSVGERSMLAVFQQVAIQIGDLEIGQLASFDLMFEGVRSALKARAMSSISAAERQYGDGFESRILKALFLVKYVKEFKATPQTLCVLMLDAFGADIGALRARIADALRRLESDTYVQRAGEAYEYLTDEEKDVEQEIKNTQVEMSDLYTELERLVFDATLRTKKIRTSDGRDYPFTRRIDDRLCGREYELTIHVATPLWDLSDNPAALRAQNMGRDELLVMLPPDSRLVTDLTRYKQTEKYIRQNTSAALTDSVRRILDAKRTRNAELFNRLQAQLAQSLGSSELIVGGGDIDLPHGNGQLRIARAFEGLVKRVYIHQPMLPDTTFTMDMLPRCLDPEGPILFGDDESDLPEAERELLALIQRNQNGGIRTTVHAVVEQFEGKPYGWPLAAILCTVANLVARAKLEILKDNTSLDAARAAAALTNTHDHKSLILAPQASFTQAQVRALKQFYEDFFNQPPPGGDAKALGTATAEAFARLADRVELTLERLPEYPFLATLHTPLERFGELRRRPPAWFLTELGPHVDELLDLKEHQVDPALAFIDGPQRAIVDRSRDFLRRNEANLLALDRAAVDQLRSHLADPALLTGGRIPALRTATVALEALVTEAVQAARQTALDELDELQAGVTAMPQFGDLDPNAQRAALRPFEQARARIDAADLIATIREEYRRFEESDYRRALATVADLGTRSDGAGAPETPTDRPGIAESDAGLFVSLREIRPSFTKLWLDDAADLEAYLELLRREITTHLDNGKKIQL